MMRNNRAVVTCMGDIFVKQNQFYFILFLHIQLKFKIFFLPLQTPLLNLLEVIGALVLILLSVERPGRRAIILIDENTLLLSSSSSLSLLLMV